MQLADACRRAYGPSSTLVFAGHNESGLRPLADMERTFREVREGRLWGSRAALPHRWDAEAQCRRDYHFRFDPDQLLLNRRV